MNDYMGLINSINSMDSIIKSIIKEQDLIRLAVENNISLNSYYFEPKSQFFIAQLNLIQEAKRNLNGANKYLSDNLYSELMTSFNRILESVQTTHIKIINIIDIYKENEKVNLFDLIKHFDENIISYNEFINVLQKIDFENLVRGNKTQSEINLESKTVTPVVESKLNSETEKHTISTPVVIDEKFLGNNKNIQKKHEIALLEQMMMVEENSARVKNQIYLDELEEQKKVLEATLVGVPKMNARNLKFNSEYLETNKGKLVIDGRKSIINRFNNRHANLIEELTKMKDGIVSLEDQPRGFEKIKAA